MIDIKPTKPKSGTFCLASENLYIPICSIYDGIFLRDNDGNLLDFKYVKNINSEPHTTSASKYVSLIYSFYSYSSYYSDNIVRLSNDKVLYNYYATYSTLYTKDSNSNPNIMMINCVRVNDLLNYYDTMYGSYTEVHKRQVILVSNSLVEDKLMYRNINKTFLLENSKDCDIIYTSNNIMDMVYRPIITKPRPTNDIKNYINVELNELLNTKLITEQITELPF